MRVALFGLLALLFAACTIGPQNGSDAGASDANAATGTIGDQCGRISGAFCNRLPGCAIAGSYTDCVASLKGPCCDQAGKCTAAAITPDVTVQTCVDAIGQEDCNLVANTKFPAECSGIPALQ
jgi:hypothetical protein